MDKCHFPNCKQPSDIIYLGKNVCIKHWDLISEKGAYLRRKLGLTEDLPQGVAFHAWPTSPNNSEPKPT